MSYYISTTIDSGFDEAIRKTTDALMEEKFGVVSRVNLHEKFSEKLNINFRKYTILGACNPAAAHQALQIEDKVGTMLPCSVIVQELGKGKVEIAAVDPVASMQAVNNKDLHVILTEIRDSIAKAIQNI